MLPWSRGLRKEFLPLFDVGQRGDPVLKPVAHIVLETLLEAGVEDVVFVVQPRDVLTVRNYFTIDQEFLARHRKHPDRIEETRRFYQRLLQLRTEFVRQPRPTGFGDAVLRTERAVGDHPFLLHASDAVLVEPQRGRLPAAMAELLGQEGLDAVLLVRRVEDPRRFGVVEGTANGRFRSWRRLDVTNVTEKPAQPRSHWAATAVYAFTPRLFGALRQARRHSPPGTELEVTSGIEEILHGGGRVAALVAEEPTAWFSVGSPETYVRALSETRRRGEARS
jgi:dTDP-glucose pyrophosphorylase